MSDTYSYEDLKTVIDTQCEIRGNSNASCLQNTNKTNFEKYQEILAKQGKKGEFNLFEVIYPKWKHENFHSKMLKFLLENYPDFFDNFLVLIGVDKENYKNPIIECERDRIDITIRSDKNVIIIENKLNWAGDQKNQIYRYYKKMQETQKLEVDKIVYLTPSKYKEASVNSLGFGKDEYNEIKEKLVHLIGFNGTPEGDLVSCLEKTEKNSLSEDKWVFLNHYIEILKQTGVGDMTVIAREFLEEIKKTKDDELGKKLAYMKEMLDNLPKARMEYWLKIFNGSSEWIEGDLVIVWKNYEKEGVTYYIDIDVIISNLAVTRVIISHRHDNSPTEKKRYDDKLEEILDSNGLGKLNRGTPKNVLYKHFDFPKEDDTALKFVKKVDAILSKL